MEEAANKSPRKEGHGTKGFLGRLARARGFRKLVPGFVKRLLRPLLPSAAYQQAVWQAEASSSELEEVSSYPAQVAVTLGIIKEFTGAYKERVAACRDMGVPYKLVNISGPDWIDVVRNCGCDGFLVYPRIFTTAWRLMYDDRLKIMADDLNAVMCPSFHDELWINESKRRMHYWLKIHGIPHPATWVFYDYDQAMAFAETADLPIVAKADAGWGAQNVRILRERSDLMRYVKRCFTKGIVTQIGSLLKNVEWGSVFLQEYVPAEVEWRMLRLAESFFGYQKLKKGDFHTGSGIWRWTDPPKALLDLTYEVTDAGGFTSMNLDVFETADGRYLINEVQPLPAMHCPRHQMRVNNRPGRYLRDERTGHWQFEEGVFCQNTGWNLRVEALLARLGHHHPWRPGPRDPSDPGYD